MANVDTGVAVAATALVLFTASVVVAYAYRISPRTHAVHAAPPASPPRQPPPTHAVGPVAQAAKKRRKWPVGRVAVDAHERARLVRGVFSRASPDGRVVSLPEVVRLPSGAILHPGREIIYQPTGASGAMAPEVYTWLRADDADVLGYDADADGTYTLECELGNLADPAYLRTLLAWQPGP